MGLNRDGWVNALNAIYLHLQTVRDLAEATENARAAPVGLSGGRYEFAMSRAQIEQAKTDLIAGARAARDLITEAVKAAAAP